MASEYEMDETEELDGAEADETETNSTGRIVLNVLTGAVIGLIVGGGLAILFAPKSGTALRSDIEEAVEELKDKAERVLDDLQGSASELMARSRATLSQTRDNLARSVEVGRDAYDQKKDELTARLETNSSATGV